ncbi:hypothetical protein L208DRAFT_1411358 [Tricholoma matsutake]|nr:hypothetical protein L208DRAFT_1411358 [Tricholoma matsutake 945]
MYIPFLTQSRKPSRKIFRRKGGGGGGRGGGGRGSGGGGRSSGSKAGSISKGSLTIFGASTLPIPITSGGNFIQARPFGSGGGERYTIPPQQPFTGREAGGGTRSQVYGTSTYGSGYPGISSPGVQDRGFPFIFYPVVYDAPAGVGESYLYRESEYGYANDSSRPGGPLYQFAILSSISTFHVIADNSTASFLQATIQLNCHNATNFSVSLSTPLDSSYARPELAIQYYRASSLVLTLDGYNNTVALGPNPSAAPIPLPSNIDTSLMNCVNQTIGTSVPLIGSASSYAPSSLMLVCFALMTWCLGDM